MSNYITIESGYFEPFKENETDPELKIWADKYFEIINKIHETILPYENLPYENSEYDGSLSIADIIHEKYKDYWKGVVRWDELSNELHQWIDNYHLEKVILELKEELRECLLHRVWKDQKSLLINESNIIIVELNGGCLVVGTGVLNTKIYGFEVGASECYPRIKSVEDSSLSADFLDAFFILNVEVYIVAAVFKKPIKTFN